MKRKKNGFEQREEVGEASDYGASSQFWEEHFFQCHLWRQCHSHV